MDALCTASRIALCSEMSVGLLKEMNKSKTFAERAEAAKVLHNVLLEGFDAALKCSNPGYSKYFHDAATRIELLALNEGMSLK